MCVCACVRARVCVCVCVQELAEEDGDSETVTMLVQELSELEEKAEQLDKQRSKGLSAIRSATNVTYQMESVHTYYIGLASAWQY